MSFWLDSCSGDLTPRDPLGGDDQVDVAIAGAGFTGLWTAYYLKKADPSLRIAIVERDIAGFGASGRNGGWCSALFAASHERIAKRHGRPAATTLQRAMIDTVDEVGAATAAEGIDAHFRKGGTLTVATSPAQLERVRGSVADDRSWGFGKADYRWLETDEARARLNVTGCLGAAFTPHCASLHPARLARGLAQSVERLGARIYEQTTVGAIEPKCLITSRGFLKADVVVRATEGYTPMLARSRRLLAPLYSLMIATEPLPPSFWEQAGWAGNETFTDGRHLIIYAQRTTDNRIAIGGRGAPYHFGSRVHHSYDREPRVFAELERVLRLLFPYIGDVRVTHRWGGPLGVPRDWYSSVGFDRSSGTAWAGGYVGDGVSTANLAGRTLRDLILGQDSELVRLPWVNHESRKWEPEPLRYLGTNLALKAMASADNKEIRTGKASRRARVVGRVTGVR